MMFLSHICWFIKSQFITSGTKTVEFGAFDILYFFFFFKLLQVIIFKDWALQNI